MKILSLVTAVCTLICVNPSQAQTPTPTPKKISSASKSLKKDAGAATTNGMSNDPRCVMVDGMNGGGDINCWEDNPADWGSQNYYSNPYEINYLTNKLERVDIVGERAPDPAGLCISGLCSAYQSLWDAKFALDNAGFWGNLFSPPPIPAPACSPLVPAGARAATSQDDFLTRQTAAGQIMQFTQGFNQIGSNGKEFIVYYSDGGSELWKYTTASPARPINKGELKLGDGVSKCP